MKYLFLKKKIMWKLVFVEDLVVYSRNIKFLMACNKYFKNVVLFSYTCSPNCLFIYTLNIMYIHKMTNVYKT